MMIEVQDLHKAFGSVVVSSGVNLTIQPGEICVIMGRSGQGKSVLLKNLTGLIKPDSGKILIDGVNVVGMQEQELNKIRMRFGMIFQNAGMLQSLNVEQNVALPLIEMKGKRLHQIRDLIAEKLEIVGLSGREKQAVTSLSGGQQKRVAIARALIQEADCMLFDEPTAGLDPPLSQTVDDVILEVNERSKATMIVVTHDLVSAFQVADRMHLLHEGKLAASGTPEEFRNSDNPIVKEFLARGFQVAKSDKH